MKKFFLFLLFINLLLTANAQQRYFSKEYDFNQGDITGYGIIPYDSNGYLAAFSIYDLPGPSLKLGLCFLDSLGNIKISKIYSRDIANIYISGNSPITSTSDGGFAIATTFEYSTYSSVVLYKFNHYGDTLWTKEYSDTLINQNAWQCKQSRDGGFVLAGATNEYDTTWGDVLLIKTDSIGNFQWKNHYGGSNVDFGESVDTCFDGGYIIAGETQSFGANSNSTFPNCYLVKTDSLGNFQWQQALGGIYGEEFYQVIQASDSAIIAAGMYTFYDPCQTCCCGNSKPYLVKLDLSGNIIWQKSYGDSLDNTTLYTVKELPNGDFIGSGVANDPLHNYLDRGLVLKINSNGDSLFYGKYAPTNLNSSSEIWDISHDIDNGYICSGYIVPNPPDTGNQEAWVLKLDSNGCEVANCLVATGINEMQYVQNIAINIYPNPSNGLFYIQNKTTDEIEKTEVFNYLGKEIFFKEGKTEEINLSNAASGIYFYSVKTKAGKIFNGKIVKQ